MNRNGWVIVLLVLGVLGPFCTFAISADESSKTADAAQAEKAKLISAIQVAPRENRRPPNIVLLLADDLGYADIGCQGSKAIPTPHIDSLAERGVRCTDGYVTAGTCSPSRAGMLTGRYQQRYGFEFNCNAAAARKQLDVIGLDPSAVTMADVLKRAGYATGMCGKWHAGFHERHHPQSRGFDEFFGFLGGAHLYLPANVPGVLIADVEGSGGSAHEILRGRKGIKEEGYLTEAFSREASAFIEQHKQHPFFLYVPFNAVHAPFQTTDKYMQRFPNVADQKRRVYYAMTSALDDAVGEILASLKKNGLEENTLVVFLSDNGGPTYTGVQSNGALRLGKLFLFEGGVRVPFIVRWPAELKGGATYHGAVSALDLLPTFAAAAGATLSKESAIDGVSLLPFLRDGKAGSPHENLFWRNGNNHAVRKGNWKLVQSGSKVWLFDLAKDVGETTNLADQSPEIVKELQKAFDAWSETVKPAAWPSRPGKSVEVDGAQYEIHI